MNPYIKCKISETLHQYFQNNEKISDFLLPIPPTTPPVPPVTPVLTLSPQPSDSSIITSPLGNRTKKRSRAGMIPVRDPKNGGDLLSQLVGQYHRRG